MLIDLIRYEKVPVNRTEPVHVHRTAIPTQDPIRYPRAIVYQGNTYIYSGETSLHVSLVPEFPEEPRFDRNHFPSATGEYVDCMVYVKATVLVLE